MSQARIWPREPRCEPAKSCLDFGPAPLGECRVMRRALLAPRHVVGDNPRRFQFDGFRDRRSGDTVVSRLTLPHRIIAGRPPAARRGLRRALANRRKCCALYRRNAHNRPPGVRVEALTNKAAHYRLHLVRTTLGMFQILTSICSAAAGNICRERRDSFVAACSHVRKFDAAAHIGGFDLGRSAQQMRTTAHENMRTAHDPRNIWW